jgi:cytochrome c553
MKLLATSVLFLAGAMYGSISHSADLQAGKATWEKLNCASCHGADAVKAVDPSYPILAGQYSGYLEQALVEYQRGARGLPATANVRKNAIMAAFATQLSKQDIANVSAWLATVPSPLSVRK